jgi:hypothetical protein
MRKSVKLSESGYNFINCRYTYEELQECESLDKLFHELQQVFGNEFDQYEFVLYSTNGSTNPAVPIKLSGDRKKVLVYISDEEMLVPYNLCKDFVAVFKSLLPHEYNTERNIFPFPLAPNRGTEELPIVPINDRPVNLFFSGNLNEKRYPLYKELTLLKHLPDFSPALEKQIARVLSKVIKSYFRTNLSHTFPDSCIEFTGGYLQGNVKTFSQMLYDSKIAICPSGFYSHETCRHFEAMRAGCVVISQPLPEHYFYKDSPIIMLDSWKDLKKTVELLLSEPDRLHELHEKTLDWWANVCSERATALYIRDKVKGIESSRTPLPAASPLKGGT